jgi:anti-sigma factor RsiW
MPRHKAQEALKDISERQRNVVFPDIVSNEARLWRGIRDQSLTTTGKIGFALLALMFLGPAAAFLIAGLWDRRVWQLVAVSLLILGPLFLAVVLATRHELQRTRGKSLGRRP